MEKSTATSPDRRLCAYLLEGISRGFRLVFDYNQQLSPTVRNMQSVLKNPQPVLEYLNNEVENGRGIGPSDPKAFPQVQTSRFGVIPKHNQPNKWRLILDLSYPHNASFNDGISPDPCSIQLASIDDAARIITSRGPGCYMAKLDIAHAYRNIPANPEDCWLLGMLWENQLFIDFFSVVCQTLWSGPSRNEEYRHVYTISTISSQCLLKGGM